MTDQNDRTGADEQAREVEVVARAVCAVPIGPLGITHHLAATDTFVTTQTEAEEIAAAVLAALAPIRAAERQEAARVELLTAADELAGRIDRVVDPDEWRRDGYDDGWASAAEAAVKVLRGRADGVTGRSEA